MKILDRAVIDGLIKKNPDGQVPIAIEELSECITALLHNNRGRPGATYEVIDEIGDVLFSMQVVMVQLNIEDEVKKRITEKEHFCKGL